MIETEVYSSNKIITGDMTNGSSIDDHNNSVCTGRQAGCQQQARLPADLDVATIHENLPDEKVQTFLGKKLSM